MHAHYIELLYNLKHVRRISAKPVQLGDQNNIAFLHLYLQGLKPWPVALSENILAGMTPAAFSAFTCNSNDCWLVETRAYPKSRINCLLIRLVDSDVY